MPILSVVPNQAGMIDVKPAFTYINTNDTETQVIATGYLNKAVLEGFSLVDGNVAVVTTKTSPSAINSTVGLFNIYHANNNWSLTPILDSSITTSVALTAAQIQGMYATPVQLLAAPGAGRLIIIDQILWDITFVSAQYAAGGAIAAQYGNTIHGGGAAASGSLAAASLNGVAASGFLSNAGVGGSLNVSKANSLNTAIYLSNASGAFTTGDSTALLYIRYRILSPQ